MTIVSSEGNLRTALLNLATGVVCQDISFVAESMFNVLDVHPASQTLFLGNSARASLLTLHYTFSPKTQLLASSLSIDCISGKIPAAVSLREEDAFFGTCTCCFVFCRRLTKLDFIVEFPLGDEITSLVCDPDASLSTDQGERTVHLYCVQTKTVQRFSVPLELTNPPSKEGCAPLLRSQQAAPVETVAESPQAGMDLLNLLMKKVDFDTSDGAVEKPEKTIQKRPQEAVTLSKKKQTGKTPSAAKDQRPSKSEAPPQIQAAPLQQKLFPDAPPTDNISQKLDVLMEKLHSVESRMQETNPVSSHPFALICKSAHQRYTVSNGRIARLYTVPDLGKDIS